MRAVQVEPGVERSARVVERDDPKCAAGECLVRVLEVGIDATDREIDEAKYGEAPAGEPRLVIGHEAVGVVVEAAEGEAVPAVGDLVVPTVRRPCPQLCTPCGNGQLDFCATGDYLERGIKGLHGYMSELFTERPEYLVPVPAALRDLAVLLEPVTIIAKVFRQVWRLQERLLWRPGKLLVIGAGNMGMLATLIGTRRGMDVVVYSRGEQRGATAEILRATGARYVDSEGAELADAVADFGAPDLALEATGHSPFAWDAAGVVARNGVVCLLSVTGGDRTTEIPSDRLNLGLVLGNRAIVGSVSAARIDFEDGVGELTALAARWPHAMAGFISHRIGLDDVARMLREPPADELKAVVRIAAADA